MQLTLKLKAAGLAVMLGGLLIGTIGCGNKTSDKQLGLQLRVISPIDALTGKQMVTNTAPTAGQSTIAVEETVQFMHLDIVGNSQRYSMKRSYTAEFVERLNGWMVYDDEGTLYRFAAGNTTAVAGKKQTLDIGTLANPMSDSDRYKVLSVTAAGATADAEHRTLVVVRRHAHPEKYDNLTYTVSSPVPADRVDLQNAWMAWVDGSLYRLDQANSLQVLKEKPVATVGIKDKKISNADRSIGKQTVTAGQVADSAKTSQLTVTQDFSNEERYQLLHYTLQTASNADWVVEQKAFMAFVDGSLYSASPAGQVVRLMSKPVVDLKLKTAQLDKSDYATAVDVTVSGLTANKQAVSVAVKRTYIHDEKYQQKQYQMDSHDVAPYNEQFKAWAVEVDGRPYVIAFPGDTPQVNRFIKVIKAPADLERPVVASAPAAAPAKGAPAAAPAKKS